MCHVSATKVGSMNRPIIYKGITILPNTRFIGLDILKKRKFFNLDAADATKGEFFDFIHGPN